MAADNTPPVDDIDVFLDLDAKEGNPGAGPAQAQQPAQPDAQSSQPRHELLRELGSGAVGVVHEALDLSLKRHVAYKRLRPEAESDPYIVSHFLTEAQITAQLDHPNVVPVYALEKDRDGALSYTMKLVAGKTLRDLVMECRTIHKLGASLDEEHALTTRLWHFIKVCEAMAYAHSKGFIHRDLKPENIMIGRWGEVYVMDWGIARPIGERGRGSDAQARGDSMDLGAADDDEQAAARTHAGMLIGSVAYMSPEQARGEADTLDARSDQYALGVILYELVTVRRAFTGKTLYETLNKVVNAKLAEFVHFEPTSKIPPELKAIVQKATTASREGRYFSVAELADDVRRYLRGESISALPEGPVARLFRLINRHRHVTLAVASVFVLLVTLAIGTTTILSLRGQRAAAEARRVAAEERQQVLLRAQGRERHLSRFHTTVTDGRNRLDAHFYSVEALLSALGAAAEQSITSAKPAKDRIYTDQDFGDAATAPPDFRLSAHYHREISLGWPVLKLAPDVRARQQKTLLRRIAPLRSEFQSLFLRSVSAHVSRDQPQQAWKLLSEQGGPITWAFIGLQEGVLFAYPGKAGYPDEYDPRQRPWYTLAAGKQGVVWGNPYVDAQGAGLLLPAGLSLYDAQGQLLGVAGMDCTFDYIIEHLMTLPEVRGVRRTLLVDDQGRIVLSSERKGEHFAAGQLKGALKLQPLGIPQVERAIRAGESGVYEATAEGRPALVASYRLLSLGWYLVVLADPDSI